MITNLLMPLGSANNCNCGTLSSGCTCDPVGGGGGACGEGTNGPHSFPGYTAEANSCVIAEGTLTWVDPAERSWDPWF